jgi:aldehyde:ferredoxin oxidoreductase
MVGIRNAPNWGLAFATASRGGDHLKALPFVVGNDLEMFRDLFGDQPAEELTNLLVIKGKMVAWFENWNALLDSVAVCKLGYKVG